MYIYVYICISTLQTTRSTLRQETWLMHVNINKYTLYTRTCTVQNFKTCACTHLCVHSKHIYVHIYVYPVWAIKHSDNTPTNTIYCRAPWAAHERDRITNEIVWSSMVQASLRVEFLLKTDSGYPQDAQVTLFTLANPGSSLRFNTHWSDPPVSALARSGGPRKMSQSPAPRNSNIERRINRPKSVVGVIRVSF